MSDNRDGAHGCIICQSETHFFFSKDYPTYPGSPFAETLTVDFWKCGACGFVISKTHQEMTESQWSQLNSSWHHAFENNIEARVTNQPPYADQALALTLLGKNDIIKIDDALDYAAGYGTFSRCLKKYFGTEISIFDRYVHDSAPDLSYVGESELRQYQLVVNSAMFEHVLDRAGLDAVDELVASDGVLMLHTVVCERIPQDPNWFYINTMVHTALHTNKSMSILMEQWGYAASVYSPQAKCWYLFKNGYPHLDSLEAKIAGINRELQTTYFHYKKGFVDYWKGF
ncbi:class I SAM-dependent methyltransferase [Burkholderia gladioli]|uniref:class I SAM-dependent methyltransferase n=1 Tax=Burkholderia gladioli TaxID=28095 RepID=UPI0016400811|nr:class I SAM-dependent methyltransferase [Burkholderia gladioli]